MTEPEPAEAIADEVIEKPDEEGPLDDAGFTFTWLVAQIGAGIAFVVFGILDGLFALLG